MVRFKKGFTLVELLVVIAIIGILVALLLPAVQAAREAARRSQCANNLKQLGLALHNHHDVYQRLPPGGGQDQQPFGTLTNGNGWGSCWMVYILPYVEQSNVYDNWQLNGSSGAFNANNNALANNLVIKGYLCPSSPLPPLCKNVTNVMAVNYVSISGASNGLIPGFTESRCNNLQDGGNICGGGVLYPNSKVGFAGMTDGSSNVMAVSEHGDFMIDTAGAKQDWRASQPWGWFIGPKSSAEPPNFNAPDPDNRSSNMVTIRYPVNQKKGWADNVSGTGVGAYVGANTPINSAHPGGVNVLLCDGSVRFISATVPLDVVARLATRDDGQVISSY